MNKNSAQRLVSLILVLSTLLACLAIPAFAATASRSNEKLIYSKGVTSVSELNSRMNALTKRFVGTYWTTNGRAANSSGTTSKYYYGIQCKGFASYIFANLYGTGFIGATNSAKYYITSPSGAKLVGKSYGYPNSTSGANTVKSVLSKAKKGDFIQVKRRTGGGPHSMIVADVSNSGITIFDCNSDGKCGVKKYTQPWATFASKNIGFSLYHSTKYPSTSTQKPSLSITPNSTSVAVGKTVQLSSKVVPSNNKVTWSTSNSKIAKVSSSGKVTGVKVGTATITAKSSSGKTATCKVTVTKAATAKVTYFKKCASKYTSIVDALKSISTDSSYAYRKKIAAKNSISNYTGTAAQNTKLLKLLKSGKLIKP